MKEFIFQVEKLIDNHKVLATIIVILALVSLIIMLVDGTSAELLKTGGLDYLKLQSVYLGLNYKPLPIVFIARLRI